MNKDKENREESNKGPFTPKRKIPSRKTPRSIPSRKRQKTQNIISRDIKAEKYTYKILPEWKLMLARWDKYPFEQCIKGLITLIKLID